MREDRGAALVGRPTRGETSAWAGGRDGLAGRGTGWALRVCGGVLMLCLGAWAQTPAIYEIPAGSPIDVHDECLADWHAVVPGPTFQLSDMTLSNSSGPLHGGDSLDLELDVYMGWTAEPPRIYAAFDMRDDVFYTSCGGNYIDKQRVTLGIDADRAMRYFETDGPSGWSYRDAQLWRIMFVQGCAEADGADFVFRPKTGDGLTRWLFAEPWSALGGRIYKDEGQALAELMGTPFDNVDMQDGPYASDMAELARGDTIGVYLMVADFDSESEDEEGHWDSRKTWWMPDLPTLVELSEARLSITVPTVLLGPWEGGGGYTDRPSVLCVAWLLAARGHAGGRARWHGSGAAVSLRDAATPGSRQATRHRCRAPELRAEDAVAGWHHAPSAVTRGADREAGGADPATAPQPGAVPRGVRSQCGRPGGDCTGAGASGGRGGGRSRSRVWCHVAAASVPADVGAAAGPGLRTRYRLHLAQPR